MSFFENIIHPIQQAWNKGVAPTLNTGDIFLSSDTIKDIANVSLSYDQFHAITRILIVKQLIKQGYVDFKVKPYYEGNWAMWSQPDMSNFGISKQISYDDRLDTFLYTNFGSLINNRGSGKSSFKFDFIYLSKDMRTTWHDLFLFKNESDLKDLGYKVISRRTRINKDLGYRRHNIYTAFKKLGNVRVINPGTIVNYLADIDFDSKKLVNYKFGKSVVLDEEIDTYGGGICGSSTAIYQGILTNKSLERTQVRNHSQWYNSLYFATIDNKYITTPGIDSTVYEGSIDLKFKNIASHPIVLIANYDGSYNGVEEIFTLGLESDRGSLKYLGKSTSTCKITVNKQLVTKSCNCYSRLINGVKKTSCYKMENGK